MRKDDLIKALLKVAKDKEKQKAKKSAAKSKSTTKAKRTKTTGTATAKGKTAPKKQSKSAIAVKLQRERQRKENQKNLALASSMGKNGEAPEQDRVILLIRDAFWLQAYWEITKATVQRAKVALNGSWHEAKPVLRVIKISSDGNTNSVEEVIEEIEIHSGVNNWYIQNQVSGKPIRLAIGYSAPKAALMHLAENLALDLKHTNVRVRLANPGFIRTRLTDKNDFAMPQIMEPEDAAARVIKAMTSRRFATSFPAPFAWVFRLFGILPHGLFMRFLNRRP